MHHDIDIDMAAAPGKAGGRAPAQGGPMHRSDTSDPVLSALGRLDLFASTDADQLASLLPDTDVIAVPAGTVVARSGTHAHQLVGVLEGALEATFDDGSISLVGVGRSVGGPHLFDGSSFDATYAAVAPSLLVVVFGPAVRAFLLPASRQVLA